MNGPWIFIALGLLVPLGVAVVTTGRGPARARLVGLSLVGSTGALLLVAIDFVVDQASSIDLALTLALLTLPGMLLFAVFEERWL